MSGIVITDTNGDYELGLPFGQIQCTKIGGTDSEPQVRFEYRNDSEDQWIELATGLLTSIFDEGTSMTYEFVGKKLCFWKETEEFVHAMSSEFLGFHSFGDQTTYIVVKSDA